jgi:hypothetical protein
LSLAAGHRRALGRVRKRTLVPGVLAGAVRRSLNGHDGGRSRFIKDLWIDLKCFASPHIREIDPTQIKGLDAVQINGPVARHSPLIVTALATLLQSDVVFELGPDTAQTTSLLARNLPNAQVFWIDEQHASRSRALHADVDGVYPIRPIEVDGAIEPADEASRITKLRGDSTSLDLLPYSGTADLVYIEASTRCDKLRPDTDAAFGLLSELGCIVWDGYTGNTCVYARLNELAREFDGPVYHIRGTRLALYSRWELVSASVR